MKCQRRNKEQNGIESNKKHILIIIYAFLVQSYEESDRLFVIFNWDRDFAFISDTGGLHSCYYQPAVSDHWI